MSYDERHKVIAVRHGDCPGEPDGQVSHPSQLQLADGSVLTDEDAIDLLRAGLVLWMIPPPGAPAYSAWEATGLPLMLQVRECLLCEELVLYA